MKKIFKRCPKSNKIVGFRYDNKWFWVISPIVAILAFIWFLFRVIPKPQRATYPCQRVAMSLFGGFFAYLASTTVIGVFLHKAKQYVSHRNFNTAVLYITLVAVAGIVTFGPLKDYVMSAQPEIFSTKAPSIEGAVGVDTRGYASFIPKDGANEPVGVGKGVHPGRVVFARDERAIKKSGSGNWWDDQNMDPQTVRDLFTTTLTELTGKPTVSEAWKALFEYFNKQKTGTAANYQAGEKIVIKLNQNQDDGTGWTKDHMTSPQLLDALLSDLINVVKVAPSDITLIDASRNFSDVIYNRIVQKFPGVRMVGQNRIKPVRNTQYPVHYSGDEIPTGYLPQDYISAKYMINIGMFRIHSQYGVTLCGKNHFGSVDFDNENSGKFLPTPMHVSWNNSYDSYSPLTELMAHDMIGGKTFLYLIDAFYTSNMQNNPIVTTMKFFDGKAPSGIFASQDGVAIDSVGFDFLACESTLNVRGATGMPDNYLHEAAQLKHPPSGTIYDPNDTGVIPDSLGVHEHWNNSVDKQYSRNLGESKGIELIYKDATPKSVVYTMSNLKIDGQDFSNVSTITRQGQLVGTITCNNVLGPTVMPLVSVVLTTSNPAKQVVALKTGRFAMVTPGTQQDFSFDLNIPSGLSNGKLTVYVWDGYSMIPSRTPFVWGVTNEND